jgi:membrane protein
METRVNELRALTIAVGRSAVRHRTTGHAAEMSFFAMLALVPATVTVGAFMHLVTRAAGEQSQVREQEAAVQSIRWIIGPGLGESVIVPFVRAQLAQPHGGVAAGGLLITWWLFSHLFHSTSHALDTVYDVEDHRRSPVRRAIALTYAFAAMSLITVTLAVMSAVPLGFSASPKESAVPHLGQIVWTVARWPLLVLVVLLTLTCLYRYSPDVRHSFRDCLPGAVLGVVLWGLLVVGFRYYLALGFGAATGVTSDDPRVTLIGQAVAAVVATSFLFYFASSAVLLGAELNATLIARRTADRAAGSPDEEAADQLAGDPAS